MRLPGCHDGSDRCTACCQMAVPSARHRAGSVCSPPRCCSSPPPQTIIMHSLIKPFPVKIYFFGGIGPASASATLAVLDVETWTFRCGGRNPSLLVPPLTRVRRRARPAPFPPLRTCPPTRQRRTSPPNQPASRRSRSRLDTSGAPPCARLGHSSCVYGGRQAAAAGEWRRTRGWRGGRVVVVCGQAGQSRLAAHTDGLQGVLQPAATSPTRQQAFAHPSGPVQAVGGGRRHWEGPSAHRAGPGGRALPRPGNAGEPRRLGGGERGKGGRQVRWKAQPLALALRPLWCRLHAGTPIAHSRPPPPNPCRLHAQEWRRLALPPGPLCVGKCHSSVQVGPRLLFFGGGMPTCADLAWLDLDAGTWGEPAEVSKHVRNLQGGCGGDCVHTGRRRCGQRQAFNPYPAPSTLVHVRILPFWPSSGRGRGSR